VGDATAAGVTVGVNAEDAVTATPAESDVGDVAGGATFSTTTTVDADSPGEYRLEVVVGADDDDVESDTNAVQFTVQGADSLSEQALESLKQARDRLTDSDGGRGGRRSLVAKLDTAIKKIEQGRQHLDQGNDRQADNQFTAASRVLGAFLNKLDSESRNAGNLSDSTRTGLRNTVRTAIELLGLAVEAS
jgi:hypothetical protein